MLELHIWGPAFGLPSIDAHCLAAIAYLQQAVPRGKWQLIASSNPGLSPTNELPALRNGDIWIGGFRNIFHYLAQYSAGEWVLDAGLPDLLGADSIAFSSFVESHGQPLLDLSLYVSSENYNAITRPIYSTIQSFPLPYLTPPSIRASAKARTSHLNLSSLDIDTADGEPSSEPSIIPESLRRPKATVSSLLATVPETNAQIRLDALATGFFEPLDRLRGKKNFSVSETQFSSLDCLALGFLSLMLVPDLPQPWLARTFRKKFPGLCSWTEELRRATFGPDVTLDNAFLTNLGNSELDARLRRLREKQHLPWKALDNGGVIGVGGSFLSTIADSIPVVGQLRRNTRMRQHGGKTTDDGVQSSSWQYLTTVGGLIAGAGLVAAYMFHQEIISFGSDEEGVKEKSALNDFGDAGAALGIYATQLEMDRSRARDLGHGQPVVELDIEVEKDNVTVAEKVT